MIKKLLGIFIICLLSITTVNAVDCDGYSIEGGRGFGFNLGEYGLTFDPNTTLGQSCDNLMDFDGSIDGNFNFNDGVFNWGSTLSSREGTFFWRTSEGLKYQIRRSSSSSVYNGTIVGFFSCSSEPTLGSYYYLRSLSYCSYHSGFDSLSTYLEGAESWGYVFKLVNSSDTNGYLCVYSNNNYICMDRSYAINTSNTLISYSEAKSEAISNPFSNNSSSPDYTFTGGNSTGIKIDIDDYIKFYEDNFGWDVGMCYVGTYDTGSVYGTTGVDFIYMSGNTIYGLYNGIYNTFGSNRIHNVGAFVNTYLLNYATWYETSMQERLYMATYNGPDQNVTYVYTGFTFPFADKPVAIYFMSELLSTQYITESSQGENIVFFCDMLLNYSSYKNGSLSFSGLLDMVDNKIKDRIDNWKDYSLGSTGGYSVPENDTGFWNSQLISGYNIPSDLNPTNLFKDTYSKLTNLVKNFRPSGDGIIPWWILYPMIFLILFRMLRH